jgi:hypothetical protein
MDFLIQWLCYLFAFLAGSAVACMIASVAVTRSADEHVPVSMRGRGAGEGR